MRMTRGEYHLFILKAVKQRSTCDRGESGAILVKEGRIIATGYVGAPAGLPHCDEVGHLMEARQSMKERPSNHCIRTVHAELNTLLQAAYFGVSIKGATMYCTMTPCFECAKAIVNVGIKEVIAVYPYQKQLQTTVLFEKAGIHFIILNPGKELY